MNVGKVLSAGEIIDSSEQDWESWCQELLAFCCEENEQNDEEKVNGYCFAWKDCFKFLKDYMPNTHQTRDLPLLFEYRPPLRNGRRMDVIILLDTKVIVMEFKATAHYTEKEMIQTNGYVHYITTSHDISLRNHMDVEGYLVRTRDHGENHNCEIGAVLDCLNFTQIITESIIDHVAYHDVDEWTDSETTTIPSIMDAVRLIYNEGGTREIRYLQDGDLGASLPFINGVIYEVQKTGGKAVIIVDGVPGSGKTYLGTQIAFDRIDATPPSVYISGNDPLINYMQTILSPPGSTNIQDDCPFVISMKTFKQNYIHTNNRPQHGVIVFDESQRAWDENKMRRNYSEIEGLLRLGDRVQAEHGSCVIVCLFGIGQAIHEGEEQGLHLWETAIENHQDWHYYVSNNVREQINATGIITEHEELHLSTAIRNNFIDLSEWINSVIDNHDVAEQRRLLNEAKRKGFKIGLVRHLGYWQQSMQQQNCVGTYGVLVSSFVNRNMLNSASENTITSSYMSANNAGAWFTGDCRAMNSAASEFVCQGLELDWPFVLFGGDFFRQNGEWHMEIPANKRQLFEHPDEILKNIYRILLSRGREGMIIVVPEGKRYKETYQMFRDMGIREISPEVCR
ncbi:MAG: DUF2075 domain-containing protein [Lachnospiraceae bacterium]|nr:DUF2075 domain-containing protein [Lachnospiraceae bacterium]